MAFFRVVPLLTLAPYVASLSVPRDGALGGASLRARGDEPVYETDPGAPEDCTFWYDSAGGSGCDSVAIAFSISVEDLIAWNPSLDASCELQPNFSYCVRKPSSTPDPSESESPSPEEDEDGNEDGDGTPSPTESDNGIETPLPIQEDMVDNCDAFYAVEAGDSCNAVASEHGITVEDIIAWNPALGDACDNMWTGYNVCVSVVGHEGTPSNGVETPTPVQPGMVDNCADFHLVENGDTCYDIAIENDISLNDFLEWNPEVGGAACTGLWLDAYVCVGILD